MNERSDEEWYRIVCGWIGRVESLMGWCVLWAFLAVSGWAVVLALVVERQGW